MFISSLSCIGQDMTEVKQNIDDLCSKKFFGRGYVKNGDQKAAHYIQMKYSSLGLHAFNNDNYFQDFSFNVNSFPQEVSFKVDKNALEIGKDVLPAPDSGSGKASGKIHFLKDELFNDKAAQQEFLKKDLSGLVLVYEQKHERNRMSWGRLLMPKMMEAVATVILFDGKLTFGVAQNQTPQPKFYVLKDKLTRENQNVSFDILALMKPYYQSQNVIGYIKGTETPDEYLFITAHYDHLGGIGKKTFFAGANDNASGVAMMLAIAKHYSTHPPKKTVVFIGFGGEEAGLVGSKFYVENPIVPLDKIKFLINLDLFGTGEDGMMAVNGKVFKEEYQMLDSLNTAGNYLSKIQSRGKAANSDHYFFSEAGVPSFFFYLMGKSWTHYHDVNDKTPLPLSDFQPAYRLIIDFCDKL
ncbi:hypothetical protein NH26_11310 [Flammeovirga pacifica]|uniref:Peptidase M28 domain-containing protein n=2 Tax=Flammeovirga pacifica TaxID=915059 RepID=A0A1S1Z0V4_FLAPC|nr:hypothetical protein NH26_11310 [Flammeovirga pacifica]